MTWSDWSLACIENIVLAGLLFPVNIWGCLPPPLPSPHLQSLCPPVKDGATYGAYFFTSGTTWNESKKTMFYFYFYVPEAYLTHFSLISKLFCTKGCMGGGGHSKFTSSRWGGGGGREGWWADKVNLLCPLLGPLEGVGPENFNFLGPKWHSLRSLPFQGPVSIFTAHPFQWPSKWIFPHQNHYGPRHLNYRYINS